MTSGTRSIRPPHCGHGKPTSSTKGRCGSSRRTPESSSSSSKRPDDVDVLAVARAAPHGQRRAPVALARERPVDVAAQPVADAPVADVLGVPVDLARWPRAAGRAASRSRCTTSAWRSRERIARAPAVRVGVLDRLGAQQPPAGAQVLDEVRVGVLDVAARVGADALVVRAVEPHRVDDVQAVLLAEAEVVVAEGDRRVHEAGAVVGGDEVAEQHGVAALAVDVGLQEREGRLVAHAVERRAGEAVEDPDVVAAEHALDERLGQHDRRVERPRLGAHVDQLGVDGDRGVGDERPRRRRPHEQLVAGLERAAVLDHRQAHVDARVDDVLVALRHLVAGERGAAPRAVGDDLVALVQQPLVVDLAQRPPHRLDVRRVERAVGVVEVDPEADALGQRVPVLEVLEDRLAAALVELGDAELLDLLLVLDPELLLDGDLDRQAVRVPAALALDLVAAHRLVARVDVLEHAREDVVRAGLAVGRRRPLPEDPRRRALAAADRLAEDVALAPARENLLLERREATAAGRRDGAPSGGGL